MNFHVENIGLPESIWTRIWYKARSMVKGGKTVVDIGLKKKKCQFGLKVGLQHIIAEYGCGTLIMMLNSDGLYRVKFDSRSIIYIKKKVW